MYAEFPAMGSEPIISTTLLVRVNFPPGAHLLAIAERTYILTQPQKQSYSDYVRHSSVDRSGISYKNPIFSFRFTQC